jgi:hypothetical protein
MILGKMEGFWWKKTRQKIGIQNLCISF